MSETVEIWHNPRCSKSRAALAWLQDRGIEPVVRLYLRDAPSADELRAVLAALDRPAADLLRAKEGATLKGQSDDALLAAMTADPALIERPVIRKGPRAVIGRPTEVLDSLF
jgi:arsenate reductase (glutaredoxin)